LFTRWLLLALVCLIIFLFLPWTQNIQTNGAVTTLKPEQRPQYIPSAIAGRIEKWYVQEGQLVRKGDTIVHISEIKAEYFDPLLVERTEQQVGAKEGSIRAYSDKALALEDQIAAMRSELDFKQQQLRNKIQQAGFKIAADSADFTQAILQDSVARIQYQRSQNLFEQGLEPRSKVEDRRVKLQETAAKVISARNKLDVSRNELGIARLDLSTVQYEYNQKIAKAESERFSTLSSIFDAEAGVSKLRIESANYRQQRVKVLGFDLGDVNDGIALAHELPFLHIPFFDAAGYGRGDVLRPLFGLERSDRPVGLDVLRPGQE